MQFTGERVVEGVSPERIWLDHVARYEFASGYTKEKNVLDISCGTGYGSRILYDRGARGVIGIDISIETINFASIKYKTKDLEFKVGDIQNIDFPANYFDVVTCFETIEHVNSQEKVFKELQRVLKPRGLLIISSPNRTVTSPYKSINDSPDNPFHTKEYATGEFISALENYFSILDIYGQRSIYKLFLLPILERIMRQTAPRIYSPEKGNPELEKISHIKEYRYTVVVCRKSKSDSP